MELTEPIGIVLTLAAEFGGTQFGPFARRQVCIGSDRSQCDVHIPEGFAEPTHVIISRGHEQTLMLTAGAPTADIYWFSASGEQQSQLYGNRRIAPGDAFALTSPDGPRFCVTLAPMPSELERERPSLWRWLRGIFGPGER